MTMATTITQATRTDGKLVATINVAGKVGQVTMYSDGSTIWTPAWLERRHMDAATRSTGHAHARGNLRTALAAANTGTSVVVAWRPTSRRSGGRAW
jgi:hypothetical protein